MQYPLELMAHGTPAWLVAKGFGHDARFWDRQVERLGRNSLVGTTVRNANQLPEHLVADEHRADWCGEKGYLFMTAGGGCILGIAMTQAADEGHRCRRTSNLVDRLMNRLYRVLYAHRGLHGHQHFSELRQRGWALLLNFIPFAPRAKRPRSDDSPAHRLNQKRYHDDWLQNLLLSASLGGFHHRT
ncbi:MAG: hypothetical protein ACKV2Q_36225 [Planctomycetaceae bacterium]